MFFRNATFFRFPPIVAAMAVMASQQLLEESLGECRLKPVGPLELSSRGFISPLGSDGEVYAHHSANRNCIWLSVGGEDRILPGAVVDRMLAAKLREIERAEGRKPGGRTRKRIKDEIITDLLPKAFIKPSRLDGYLDLDRGLLVVDTASRKQAEGFVSELRRALGSFPALPINAEVAPRAVLRDWIEVNELPADLNLGDEATLKDPIDKGAVVRVTRQELSGDEIAKHLEAGKQVTRLALTLDDHISFTIDEDLALRKLKLLDGAVDKLQTGDRDDLAAELDARFFLLTEELGRTFDVLSAAFKFSRPEA